jgi:hypothetical protein
MTFITIIYSTAPLTKIIICCAIRGSGITPAGVTPGVSKSNMGTIVSVYFFRAHVSSMAYQDNIARNKPLPPEYLGLKDARSQFSLRHFLRHKKVVRDYCVQDCIMTKELAENWIDTLYKQFKFLPRNYRQQKIYWLCLSQLPLKCLFAA